MNRNTRTAFFVFSLALLTPAMPSHAQFFKKLFGKEEKKPVRKTPVKKPIEQAKPVAKDEKEEKKAKEFEYPKSQKKDRYRVDVFAQLYLDELVVNGKPLYKDRVPDKALNGVNFYEGIKLASDTLANLYNLDLYVHDITDPLQTPQALIASKSLDSTDLIIGAVPAASILPIAKFAKTRNVNFISTLSPADGGVKDNPYFTLLQPTLQAHCDAIKETIQKKFKKQQVLVMHRSLTVADANAYKFLIDDLKDKKWSELLCNKTPTEVQLRNLLDSESVNVIAMPILDLDDASSLVNQLSTQFPTYRFEIFGMPTWRTFTALRNPEFFPNAGIYYTTPFFFDATTASGQTVAASYQKQFGGIPGDMVYRGYEATTWLAHLLSRYGTIFNEKMGDNGTAGFTRFDVKPRYDDNKNLLYNENRNMYLFRFQSGSYTVDQ